MYDMRVTRAALRELIDELPEHEIENVTELILAYEAGDRARISMLLAPEAEAESDEFKALGEADRFDDGSRASTEEVRRELGLST